MLCPPHVSEKKGFASLTVYFLCYHRHHQEQTQADRKKLSNQEKKGMQVKGESLQTSGRDFVKRMMMKKKRSRGRKGMILRRGKPVSLFTHTHTLMPQERSRACASCKAKDQLLTSVDLEEEEEARRAVSRYHPARRTCCCSCRRSSSISLPSSRSPSLTSTTFPCSPAAAFNCKPYKNFF